MNKKINIIPVILAGGVGTRLWPLSRKIFPKQFQKLTKNNQKSLIQITQERVSKLENILNPIIICNEEHRFIVAEQMREIFVEPLTILLEPVSKNTAPAVTIATLKALEYESDPLLLFLPADHLIKNKSKFLNVIERATKFASEGRLITFGITPTHPETGYGYIEAKDNLNGDLTKGFEIKKFIEKPNHKKACEFIQNKKYFWNSGIFLFQASSILNETKKFHPEMVNLCKKALENERFDLNFQRIEKDPFSKCEEISIDVAIMEKTNLGTVLPLDVGWSDIGSWQSLWEREEKDKLGNVLHGKVLDQDSKNCYIRSEDKLVVSIGLEDIVLVDTSDAILITKKNLSQNVKDIVQSLNDKGYQEGIIHKKVFRPWGYYISIGEGPTWQIKKLIVNPKSSLSLQMHRHRSEHWIVVEGFADIEIDAKKMRLKENESIYVPKGSKHRLSNSTEKPFTIIEVQSGSYLGEDDIVRFEDKYGRH